MSTLKALLRGKREVIVDSSGFVGGDDGWLKNTYDYQMTTRSLSKTVLDDTNTIFIDNAAGSDANPGTEASPKKTVTNAHFAADLNENIYFFCFIGTGYDYVEGKIISDKYSFFREVSSTYTLSGTSFPSGRNDTNTIWVDPVSGDDTTGTGIRTNPYKTINKALTGTTGSLTTIAVLVDDTNNEITENMVYYDTNSIQVSIIPYQSSDAIETKSGQELTINFDKTQDIQTLSSASGYNVEKTDYLRTRNFNSSKYEQLYWCNAGVSVGAIEYGLELKTLANSGASKIDSLTSKNWERIVEYEYAGNWFLLLFSINAGTLFIFSYRDDGTKTELSVPLTHTTSNAIVDVLSDGEVVLIGVTEQDASANNYFSLITLGKELNPITPANYVYILGPELITTETFGMKFLYLNNFAIFSTNSTNFFYLYDSAKITSYKFANIYHEITYLDGKVYGFENKNSVVNIYELDINDQLGLFVKTINSNSTANALIEYYDKIYFWLDGIDEWYIFDGLTTTKISDLVSGYNLNINGDATVFRGMLPMFTTSATQNLTYAMNTIFFGFGGVAITRNTVYINSCGSCIDASCGTSSQQFGIFNDRFQSSILGILQDWGSTVIQDGNVFYNTDYPTIYSAWALTGSRVIDINLYINFKTAITLEEMAQAQSYTIIDSTFDLGQVALNLINVDVTNIKMFRNIFSRTAKLTQVLNSEDDIEIYECVIEIPFRFENAIFKDLDPAVDADTNSYGTPIFRNRDAINLDYPDMRLQRRWIKTVDKSNFYKFNSPGVEGTIGFVSFDIGFYARSHTTKSEEYGYEWETEFDPMNDTKGILFPNVSSSTTVNGSVLFVRNGRQPRVTLFWEPGTEEERQKIKDLYAILERPEAARLFYNDWTLLSESLLITKAQLSDAGLQSGPTVIGSGSVKARFDNTNYTFWQNEKTWHDNEWAGWFLYLSYDDSGTRKSFIMKILTNTEDTMILQDIDELPDTLPPPLTLTYLDNVSDDLLFVIGAIDVACNVSDLQTQFDVWYDKAGTTVGPLEIELLGQ
jgi:hypothetical protein